MDEDFVRGFKSHLLDLDIHSKYYWEYQRIVNLLYKMSRKCTRSSVGRASDKNIL